MFSQSPAGMRRVLDPSRSHRPQDQASGHGVSWRATARASAVLAAALALALWLVPGSAHADPPHGHGFSGHFAAGRGPRGGHFGGPRWRAGGPGWHGDGAPRGHWDGRGGPAWHAGPAARGDWHGHGGWDGGGWRGADRGDWHAEWPGGWDGERWHAGWDGGEWDHDRWRGALWVGGYWNGLYWPPVNYGWNYPWFMATIPFGAMTLTFGGVPYYYVNHVYYVWNPYYDGYVVADPPPVADASAPPAAGEPPPAEGANGVLALRITPLKGQNSQQTANDRYACNRWAVSQSGFNPVSAQQDAQASPQMRSNYRRAFTACLQARGYSVH
jgi:hypothetical protein